MKKESWMLAEDIPNIDFFFCQTWLHSFVNNMENSVGVNYEKILGVFQGNDMKFYYGEDDCLNFANTVVSKIVREEKFGHEINENIVRYSDELLRHSETIPFNLASFSNEQLWIIIRDNSAIHTSLYEWGWLSNATDMFHPVFTNLLKDYLRSKLKTEEEVNAAFVLLTSPTEKSEEAKQHGDFLKLAVLVQNEGQEHVFIKGDFNVLPLKIQKAVSDYAEKYEAISALWVGEPFGVEHYLAELQHYFKQGKNPAEELEEVGKTLELKKHGKEKKFSELNVDAHYRNLFNVFANFMLTKFYRRYSQLRNNYAMRRVFKEMASRFNISFEQARFLRTNEYKDLLVDGSFDVSTLKEREKFSVLYSKKDMSEVFVGEKAEELAAEAEEKIDVTVNELRGQCACLGKVVGRVKIIHSPKDMAKMEKGDVLVAIATNPDVVPAMKKAAAIVTEQGGVTCHAAIVSRELNIPCVIGTKIATKIFHDGELVEVDASKGVVKRISG